MKVIIVGVGEVGRISTGTVSKAHDVFVIERDETILNNLKIRLNVSIPKADWTNLNTIRYAIGNHDAADHRHPRDPTLPTSSSASWPRD